MWWIESGHLPRRPAALLGTVARGILRNQETETKKEGTSPKTGDTSSALPVAGAGLASLGVALATILKKRK